MGDVGIFAGDQPVPDVHHIQRVVVQFRAEERARADFADCRTDFRRFQCRAGIERVIPNGYNGLRQGHRRERVAFGKRIAADRDNPIPERHVRKRPTTVERVFRNRGQPVSEAQGRHRFTPRKGVLSERGQAVGKRHRFQRLAVGKGFLPDGSHRVAHGQRFQRAAIPEGKVGNLGHARRERHRGQIAAGLKGVGFDTGHAFGNADRCQRPTVVKRLLSDLPHIRADDKSRNPGVSRQCGGGNRGHGLAAVNAFHRHVPRSAPRAHQLILRAVVDQFIPQSRFGFAGKGVFRIIGIRRLLAVAVCFDADDPVARL